MRRPLVIMLTVVAGLLVLTGAVLGGLAALAHRRAERIREAFVAKATVVMPTYLAAADELSRAPFFVRTRPDLDAGPFLNPRLPWVGGPPESHPPSHPTLALPASLPEWTTDWPQWPEPREAAALDFGWMTQAQRYGHWSLLEGGPLFRLTHRDPVTMPMPNFVVLQAWTKLRLIRAHRTGELSQACAEITHLAALTYSTETLLGAMIALTLHGIVQHAGEVWKTEIACPDLLTRAQIEEGRAVAWGATVFQHQGMPEAMQVEASRHGPAVCLAANELILWAYLRKLGATDPALLTEALAHPPTGCRLELARWFVSAPPDLPTDQTDSVLQMMRDGELPDWMEWLGRLVPSVKREAIEVDSLPTHGLDSFRKSHRKALDAAAKRGP